MDIQASLDQLLQSQQVVVEQFYELFFERCPEAAAFFNDVDLSRQSLLLTMGLNVVVTHYRNPSPATAQYLQILGSKHRDLGIPQELFERFCEALLEFLAGFHGESWSEGLADQWRQALRDATKIMLSGYQTKTRV